jgi:hypothetical protein
MANADARQVKMSALINAVAIILCISVKNTKDNVIALLQIMKPIELFFIRMLELLSYAYVLITS